MKVAAPTEPSNGSPVHTTIWVLAICLCMSNVTKPLCIWLCAGLLSFFWQICFKHTVYTVAGGNNTNNNSPRVHPDLAIYIQCSKRGGDRGRGRRRSRNQKGPWREDTWAWCQQTSFPWLEDWRLKHLWSKKGILSRVQRSRIAVFSQWWKVLQ